MQCSEYAEREELVARQCESALMVLTRIQVSFESGRDVEDYPRPRCRGTGRATILDSPCRVPDVVKFRPTLPPQPDGSSASARARDSQPRATVGNRSASTSTRTSTSMASTWKQTAATLTPRGRSSAREQAAVTQLVHAKVAHARRWHSCALWHMRTHAQRP